MIRYIIKRLVLLALMLWLVSLITFGIFFGLPSGNPVQRFVGRSSTPQTIALARKSLGLDKPLYVQYLRFAEGIIPWPGLFLNRNVYFSYNDGVPVKDEIFSRVPVTAVLAGGGAVIWVVLSLLAGIFSAIRPRGLVDRLSQGLGFLFISVPTFATAYLFLYIFWYRAHLLPGTSLPPGESLFESVLHGRFVLGWFSLALFFVALYARTTRRHVIEMLRSDAIRTARGKGLSEGIVVWKHALRGALVPLVTMFGIDFGGLLGGTITLELVFNLPGLGQYTYQALLNDDLPAMMGVTVFAAVVTLIAALVVDLMYAWLDPRIRLS